MKVITIGRHSSNEVIINDSKVSRNHLQIIEDESNNFMVVDCNSTNGTFVNGQRISGEVPLNPNDSIKIGDTTLPWQSYFPPSQPSPKPISPPKPQTGQIRGNAKPHNRKIWIVVASVVGLLVIGGVSFVVINNDKKAEQEQTTIRQQKEKEESEAQARQTEQEAMDAVQAAVDARIKAEEATRKAAQSKSKEDIEARDKALAAQEKAEDVAKEKNAEADRMKKAAEQADKEKKKALTEKEEAEKKAATTQKELDKQKEENEKLKQERDNALEAARQTKQTLIDTFNRLLRNETVNETILKAVCEHFKYPVESDAKQTLTRKFNAEDTSNERRKEIIAEINKQATNAGQ